ncbi:malonate decarboxylase holo-ACP synthase [Orbus sturtevantii]|uniref:malonate decarboxylase holo-ACP synthase n=1 Tax=Orbus sturtevantii TaxID=3074109 RepID=UPI00370D535B
MNINAHDLLWISRDDALVIDGDLPEWFIQQDITLDPVVVRREALPVDWIPIGIRGITRSQRLAAKVRYADITKRITPEEVIRDYQHNIKRSSFAALDALQCLIDINMAWQWGVTGSTAYQLVTDRIVMNEQSDLDLLFRCPCAKNRDSFIQLSELLSSLPCKIDAQIETPQGAFALKEYVRDNNVMLKTPYGPIMTKNPWAISRKI